MKKLLLETSFSKIYMLVVILVSLLIMGSYFSYAMFTVSKEKSNAISIVTGNLTYELLVDGEEGNALTVPSNSSKEFIVTLSNPNNRIARFNFYYIGDLSNGVEAGYIEEDGYNITPEEVGINLEKSETAGSSNTYIIKVSNITDKEITISLGVEVGLDYNDLTLPSDGHLFRKIMNRGTVSEVIEDDIMNRLNYEDSEQTFITGENPYNYIWYSGKLWRAVSIDTSDNSVKLVTEWNISTISYDDDSTTFEGSHIEMWLNDTSVDGFLGNLREPEKFIKMNSLWNATEMNDTNKPDKTTLVEDAVGLLNYYEYIMSYKGTNYTNGYLNNELYWWTLTPNDISIMIIRSDGQSISTNEANSIGIRPSINLKPEIKIVDGRGTEEDPYRLEGDNDINLSGTLLSQRYSGEYIRFGTSESSENNLYRIVSHENGTGTKITSAEPLKENGEFKISEFGNDVNYSSTNTIGSFLNGEYLSSGTYITNEQVEMIEENTAWYLGTVVDGANYKLAKYKNIDSDILVSDTTKASVGLLRIGELLSGQFNHFQYNGNYWLLTKYNTNNLWYITNINFADVISPNNEYYIRPSLNLKSNVIITGGDGTLQNPFQLSGN